jgi:hypothetical protein
MPQLIPRMGRDGRREHGWIVKGSAIFPDNALLLFLAQPFLVNRW